MTPFLLLLAACSWEPEGVEPAPNANTPVGGAQAATVVVTAEETELLREELDEARRQVEALDDRLSRMELLVAEMQEAGIGEADLIRYDPSRSELDGRSVQAALDELAGQVEALQGEGAMGEPSNSLFQMHRDDGPMGGARLAPRAQGQQGQQGQKGRQGGPNGGPPPGKRDGPSGANNSPNNQIGPPDGKQPP